jgi:hypothetical protein
MNPRLQLMLESRQLDALPASDDEIQGMWSKAARSLRSSRVEALDPDSAFTLAYQSALQAATAILRATGYRVRGDGHHRHTFAAVAALDAGELSDTARDLNVIRARRHGAIYDWEVRTEDRDVHTVRTAAERLLEHGARWMTATRPHLILEAAG